MAAAVVEADKSTAAAKQEELPVLAFADVFSQFTQSLKINFAKDNIEGIKCLFIEFNDVNCICYDH